MRLSALSIFNCFWAANRVSGDIACGHKSHEYYLFTKMTNAAKQIDCGTQKSLRVSIARRDFCIWMEICLPAFSGCHESYQTACQRDNATRLRNGRCAHH